MTKANKPAQNRGLQRKGSGPKPSRKAAKTPSLNKQERGSPPQNPYPGGWGYTGGGSSRGRTGKN